MESGTRKYEPWLVALQELVEPEGWWVGSEKELTEELVRRAGKEASESEGFPSTLDELGERTWTASEVFARADIDVLDYNLMVRTFGVDGIDAPGWGPETAALVYRGDCVFQPDYIYTLGKVLERWDPFLLALFLFASNGRLGNGRWWEGTTPEFVEAVRRQRPDQESVPDYISECFRPARSISPLPEYEDAEEKARLLWPLSPEDYEAFAKRMRKSIPFLESIGIRARIELHPNEVGLFEDVVRLRDWVQVRWVVRAPRWFRTWHL